MDSKQTPEESVSVEKDIIEEVNESDEGTGKGKKITMKRFISTSLEIVFYVCIIFFCWKIVPEYIVEKTIVDGPSMEDTLHNGDKLLINKLSYRFWDPERYDIIVFRPKGPEVEEYYVKRIFGLPGETIYIDNNKIYINGKQIEDSYAKDAMDDEDTEIGTKKEPYTLKDDEYYVLGDHRSVSMDSRSSPENNEDAPGPVKRSNIVGKVFFRIWPLNKFGTP